MDSNVIIVPWEKMTREFIKSLENICLIILFNKRSSLVYTYVLINKSFSKL